MEKAALRPQYISFLEKQKQKEGSLLLSGNQLKIIAMITMLIDHIGVNLFPSVTILRVIGRLSFPIFAYMIAEGCRYTRDRKNYLFTIAALGILCQLVFYVFTQSLYQGILITFTISIVTIYAIDGLIYGKNNYSRAAWGGGIVDCPLRRVYSAGPAGSKGFCAGLRSGGRRLARSRLLQPRQTHKAFKPYDNALRRRIYVAAGAVVFAFFGGFANAIQRISRQNAHEVCLLCILSRASGSNISYRHDDALAVASKSAQTKDFVRVFVVKLKFPL